MTTHKSIWSVMVSQGKRVAIFAFALVLLNAQVSPALAADDVSQTTTTQTALLVQPATATVPAQSDLVIDPTIQPTVQEVLLNVCKENGYGEDCAKTLLGMMWNESSNQSTIIGDHGAARGYFQIHYKMHKISTDCAEDLVCSANWTLKYMEQHSYPKYVKYAVQCHNSCGVNNGYAAKAIKNGNTFWEKPLEIKQANPVELAMK